MHYSVNSLNSKVSLFLEADKFATSIKPFNLIPNDPLGTIVYLENAQKILVTTRVRKDSLKYYRYSIVENDTNMVVNNALLTKVNFVWNNRSSWPGYLTMDLGISDVANKKLTVKIYRLPDASQVTTLIIYNKPIEPAKILDASVFSERKSKNGKSTSIALKNGSAINVDEKTKGVFISMKKTDLDFVYHLNLIHTNVEGDNITFNMLSNQWKYDSSDGRPYFVIDVNYFNKPGEYKIVVVPQLGSTAELSRMDENSPNITFKVLSAPRVYLTKDLIRVGLWLVLMVGSVATIIIFVIRKRSQNRLKVAHKKTETAKAELDHIRSQLNPHFVFNSLSGIQNLMNQNETEKANAYLSKFARLTRSILNEEDLISIQDEHTLLDDYLAMECLRFKFNYEIKINEAINFLNTEIPTMLLQPFVENAVKHSMSILQDKGSLLIEFKSDHKNLILSVQDNGKGFDVAKNAPGLGLSLCRKRIDLLNQVYNECPILLTIDSGTSGTSVIIILKNWL